ncbi:hypothetical protein FQA39_LY05906, partial [Lamprigera yunnana]
LMVIVCSTPANYEQRIAIREGWGVDKNISKSIVNVYFLLGLTNNATVQELIEIESQIYNVVQENFIDTYNNNKL